MENQTEISDSISTRIQKLVTDYAGGKNTVLASTLGINEANVRSYIRGTLPKADVLEKIVLSYDVDPYWLLTGHSKNTHDSVNPAVMIDMISTVKKQAEEIGRLKERIKQLEQMLGKAASSADTADIADVG